MKRSEIRIRHRDTRIMQLRAYEDMLIGGTLIFPLLGKQVRLKKQLHVPQDHQSVTPERLIELAAQQKVGCTVSDWAESTNTYEPAEVSA